MNCSSIADGSDASFLGNKKGENFSSRPLKKNQKFHQLRALETGQIPTRKNRIKKYS